MLGIAVALGTLGRNVGWLGSLVEHAGRWESAWIAAGASVLVNNLPAAVVLAAHAPAHPRALLLGLDLGPNFAVTGSLSALLWLQVARANGARPSVVRYTLLGVVLTPISLSLALLAAAGSRAPHGTIAAVAGVVRISTAASRGSRSRNSRTSSPSTGRPGVRSSFTSSPPGSSSARIASQSNGRPPSAKTSPNGPRPRSDS